MFMKVVYKRLDKNGKQVLEYRMVESYRTALTVKHQIILHLGRLNEIPLSEQKKELGKRIDQIIKNKVTGQQDLFKSSDLVVEELAQKYANQIVEQQKIDISNPSKYELINSETIRNEDIVEVGSEWMAHQTLIQLDMDSTLKKCGFKEEEMQLAFTHIISRAVHPASELATSKWIKQNSGVCEITDYDKDKVTKDKLYQISHKLFLHKDTIEQSLSHKTNDLFDIEDKIIIYDLSNTYFEGRMKHSKIAKFGRSKEKRSDAKLIVLALVVNQQGFIKYSKLMDGNTSDSSSLLTIIEELTANTSHLARKPIVVIDAGIATDKNLKLLKAQKFDYMCVSRSGLQKYTIDPTSKEVKVTDNKKQTLRLQKVEIQGCSDHYLRVHSQAKQAKEVSMNEQFKTRFEAGLEEIKLSLSKNRGVKTIEKVHERIGRLKQKYPSISKYYHLEIVKDSTKVSSISWEIKEYKKTEGHYLLRTNLDSFSEAVQWQVYNVIREIEATFRVLKTDLDLRPIYHKNDESSKAYLHLGILAYWVVNTIRYQLKRQGITNDWSSIVNTMNTQKIVTTKLDTADDRIIHIRKFSEPNNEVSKIYTILGYKQKAFGQRKVVVTPSKLKKTKTNDNQIVTST